MERTPCSYVSYGKVAEEERAGTGLMDYIAIVLLVMCLPLGKILPATIAWENGPLEILQVLILLAGAGLACFFAKGNLRSMWSGVGGVFFLMIGRELSWGRVFFPTGVVEETGPQFVAMRDIPGHLLIHAAIFAVIVGIIIVLFKHTDFAALRQIKFPTTTFLLCTLAFLLQLVSERYGFAGFTPPEAEIIEEVAEVVCYGQAVYFVWYYGVRLRLLPQA